MRVQVASPRQAGSQPAEDDEPPFGLRPGGGARHQHRLMIGAPSRSNPQKPSRKRGLFISKIHQSAKRRVFPMEESKYEYYYARTGIRPAGRQVNCATGPRSGG